MEHYQRTQNLSESAREAGVDRKTARDYVRGKRKPGEARAHTWRTRPDPFEEVGEEVASMLESEPALRATSIFEELCRRYPGRFAEGQLRTLQRRVGEWKREHGRERRVEIYFAQEHEPGRLLQLDWFHPKSFEVSIAGEPFRHLLGHAVLTYSNWESVTVCRSESFPALKSMLQDALWKLGGVPRICQSDNSSTATHALTRKGKKRGLNTEYLSLVNHYGMRAETINVGAAHENGDVESSHGHLRAKIRDALALRGHADFPSLGEYRSWLDALTEGRNLCRTAKVGEEKAVLGRLPQSRLPEYREVPCRVNKYGMARIGKGSYSVPKELRDRELRARIYEHRLEVWEGDRCAMSCGHTGALRGGAYVDWRHLIVDLCRKPGAFARYRYREWFFPGEIWKRTYEHLEATYSEGRAGNDYVHLLAMNLEEGRERMEGLLQARLEGGEGLNLDLIRADLGQQQRSREICHQVGELRVDLGEYDRYLSEPIFGYEPALHGEEVCCG